MSDAKKSPAHQAFGDVAPKLADMTEQWLFGDIWERPGLPKRDRSVITVAVLTALYRIEQLPFHLNRALDNGVTKEELVELITHVTMYAGWPTGASAIMLAKKVFAERGV